MNRFTQVVRSSPYKGLEYFSEEDQDFFFGRERERDLIISNLKGRRLTILYGPSGVGKSSVLRAGVAARLRELAHRSQDETGTPEFIPVVFSNWRDDPLAALTSAIRQAVAEFTDTIVEGGPGLAGAITAAAQPADAALLVILDQFEEYLLYHAVEEQSPNFASEFPLAMACQDLPAAFLVSIREDALAQLDRFKGQIPTLFDTLLRVNPLTTSAARRTIEEPIIRFNAYLSEDERVTIQPQLVDAVLEQVRAGRVRLEKVGVSTVDGTAGDRDAIEAPYLQLVMARLWEEEREAGSRDLRLATLETLGGAQEIVRRHLDSTLGGLTESERQTAADVFFYLVTPSGTKIVHAAPDLANYSHHSVDRVQSLLEKLERGNTRIVRPVPPPDGGNGPPRYEIFHDVLAPAILDWRRRYVERKTKHVRRRAAISIGLSICILGAAIGWYVAQRLAPSPLDRVTAFIPSDVTSCTQQPSSGFWLKDHTELVESDCSSGSVYADFALFNSQKEMNRAYAYAVSSNVAGTMMGFDKCGSFTTFVIGCEQSYASGNSQDPAGRVVEWIYVQTKPIPTQTPVLAFTVKKDLLMVFLFGVAANDAKDLAGTGNDVARHFRQTTLVTNSGIPATHGPSIPISPSQELINDIPAGLDQQCLAQNPYSFWQEQQAAEFDCHPRGAPAKEVDFAIFNTQGQLNQAYEDRIRGDVTNKGLGSCGVFVNFTKGCETTYPVTSPSGLVAEVFESDGSTQFPLITLSVNGERVMVFLRGNDGTDGNALAQYFQSTRFANDVG